MSQHIRLEASEKIGTAIGSELRCVSDQIKFDANSVQVVKAKLIPQGMRATIQNVTSTTAVDDIITRTAEYLIDLTVA